MYSRLVSPLSKSGTREWRALFDHLFAVDEPDNELRHLPEIPPLVLATEGSSARTHCPSAGDRGTSTGRLYRCSPSRHRSAALRWAAGALVTEVSDSEVFFLQ